jgi:hypothetical protein
MYTNRSIVDSALPSEVKTELLISVGMMREKMQRMALNEPDVFSRSVLTGGFTKGSTAHAAWTTATMFKTFLVGHWVYHMKPLFDPEIARAQRISMASRLMVSSLVTGAIMNTIMSYMIKGESPVPEDATAKDWAYFLLKSLAYGGGLGLPFDAFMASQNVFGGLSGYISGPAGGMVGSVLKTAGSVGGNAFDVITGDQDFLEAIGNTGSDLAKLLQTYHPVPVVKTLPFRWMHDRFFDYIREGMETL